MNVQAQLGQGSILATSSCTDSAGLSLDCSAAQGGAGAGNRIKVDVGETFTFFTPLINGFWGGSGLPVGASATAAVVVYAPNGGGLPGTCSTVPPTPTFTWMSPNISLQPLLISVDAGASSNPASPCHIVGYEWDFGGAASVATAKPNDPLPKGARMTTNSSSPAPIRSRCIPPMPPVTALPSPRRSALEPPSATCRWPTSR